MVNGNGTENKSVRKLIDEIELSPDRTMNGVFVCLNGVFVCLSAHRCQDAYQWID
jgi:hypothetical protein